MLKLSTCNWNKLLNNKCLFFNKKVRKRTSSYYKCRALLK